MDRFRVVITQSYTRNYWPSPQQGELPTVVQGPLRVMELSRVYLLDGEVVSYTQWAAALARGVGEDGR